MLLESFLIVLLVSVDRLSAVVLVMINLRCGQAMGANFIVLSAVIMPRRDLIEMLLSVRVIHLGRSGQCKRNYEGCYKSGIL